MIKLLIVDDEQIEREGLQTILQKPFQNLLLNRPKMATLPYKWQENSSQT